MASNWVVALIHEENGMFGISFPDFPGVVSGGASVDEAVARGKATLDFHVAGMLEDGEALPNIRTLSEFRADPEYKEAAEGAAVVLVNFEVPGRSVRINISMDENLIARIDQVASRVHQSRSAFLAAAAKDRIKAVDA